MPERITSVQNPRIKAAAKLRQRRAREQQGRTIIDGVREIERALAKEFPLLELFLCDELLVGAEADALRQRVASQPNLQVYDIPRDVCEKLSFGERSEGAVSVANYPVTSLDACQLSSTPLIVVLEDVEKPGNLGAILRTADAVGADCLIAADARTDLFNPNAIRASLGTIFAVPTFEATTAETMAFLRKHGVQMFAARVEGAVSYEQVRFDGPTALILGSEAEGLSDRWLADDVTNIRLPMRGIADSLNVSTTAAVLLYEADRQRQT
ncbi:TrmH family RNA methyltransferase [Blastopirellula retiformator]|uniref:23S rRNA (Uridine(2479)-2'-O)-methyltransferase n=1 Tax=Blastopirellula retiformator TaxID=2527970 RepID=A0A5C5VKF1_9BACT|nr:RNA methyltransferase [Blastopirellula retiformator]TWT39094.1 23S rRNA (uridine(2479)-2'-O)-methyltransferase [Blastopirellula retiformator]